MRTLTGWAGSKRRLLKDYLPFFPQDTHFLDLFAGSGIVSANTTAPSKHLNDVDGDWVKVLWSVTEDTDNFVDRFLYWGEQLHDRDTYFVLLDKLPSLKGLDYAATRLLLQKVCFGNIPAKDKDGNFRQGFGSLRKSLLDTAPLFNFAEALEGATFSARSWEEVPFRGFVFADPPYRSFYGNPVDYAGEVNHEDLAEALKAHGNFAYCSTDLADGWLDEHFPGYDRVEVNIKHTAKRASVDAVKEVLVYA